MKFKEKLQKIFTLLKTFFSHIYLRRLIIFVIGFGIGSFFATHKIVVYKHDNPMEEMVEKLLEDKFGFKVDLTPDSSEDSRAKKSKKSRR
jgi:hypothetical protein